MKRWWWWLVSLLAFALLLVWLGAKPKGASVWIGTVPDAKSLLMEPNDPLEILVYFSQPNTFFVDPEVVLSVSIVDETTIAAMKLIAIDYLSTEFLNAKTYSVYRFRLGFDLMLEDGFELEWIDAQLMIRYVEQVELTLPIGALSVRIGSVVDNSPLSMTRLYGRKGEACGIERVLIGLTNLSSFPIRLTRFSNGFSTSSIQLERWSMDHPESAVADLVWFGERWTEEEFWLTAGETRYLVLRIDQTTGIRSNRFYLNVVWDGSGWTDSLLVDDFQFVTEGGGTCDGATLREIEFRYPA